MYLENKVAIVTGGAQGLGYAIAERFAREGARVVIADRQADEGRRALEELNREGDAGRFVEVDVTRSEDVARMVGDTLAAFGKLDIVVNNAGIRGGKGLLTELPEDDWDRVLDINLGGVYLVCKHTLPVLVEQGSGVIINVSSVAGLVGTWLGAAYNASKSGVVGLTRALAIDYAPHGVRVNAVCPGYCDTEMIRDLIRASEEPETLVGRYNSLHPLGRLGKPEEISNAVLFLASDESSFVTGSNLVVDGGYTAW